jgi:hypothetical protein
MAAGCSGIDQKTDGRIGGKIAVFLCVPAGCHINFAAVVIRCIGHQRTVRLFSRHGSQNTCPACFHQFPDVFAHRQLLLNSLNYGGILTQDHQKYETHMTVAVTKEDENS